jgi:7-carboxy-7-deazaguanine synthase
MQIQEIFFSLQGEGPATGQPAIFIRVASCNLRCANCDTPAQKVQNWAVGDVAFRTLEHLGRHPDNCRVVLTGGDPMLQAGDLMGLLDKLSDRKVDIETNGIIPMEPGMARMLKYIVVSPKKDSILKPQTRREYFAQWRPYQNVSWKFVLGGMPWMWNEIEIKNLMQEFRLEPSSVWVMPGGAKFHDLTISGPNTWKAALRLGCNFSDRLHIRNLGK